MAVGQQDLIRTIETLSYKALPALERRYYDGWLIRYANGYTKRANSVNPIYASDIDIDLKLSQCETFFTRKQLPIVFKMTDNAYPQNLDDLLAQQHYEKIAETGVYTMSMVGQGNPSADVQISTTFTDSWLNTFADLNNISTDNRATLKDMLKLIPTRCGFLQLMDGDDVIGVALGVMDDIWMGIFDVVVHPNHRGNGHGRKIIDALLHWGAEQGGETAYLQVQADNTVASNLYQSIGFSEQYRYWYRRK